jgi:hypothetical protein
VQKEVVDRSGQGVVMSEQRAFASLAWQAKGKVTRRERFPAEMDSVIPWLPCPAPSVHLARS